MQMQRKRVSDSYTEQIQILMPAHINGRQRMFGGKLLEWIDVVAGVVARRHAGRDVTTASIDHLRFLAPAYVNSTVVLAGRVTYVGRTSMEVRVDTFVEALDGTRTRVNRAYLVMVALDEAQNPTPVPGLLPETEEEKREYEEGRRRQAERKARRGDDD